MNGWLRAGLGLGLALLAVAQIPHLWSERAQRSGATPAVEYSGAPATYNDEAMTYLGWMRQAREGRFLMEDRVTPEDHPREYINVLFYALGTVARLGGWSLEGVYSVARVVCGALLVLLLARLARRLFDTPAAQLAALLMFLLASGWEGVAAVLEKHAGGAHVSSPAWWMPEMSTFFSFMLYPHFLAGFAAMIGALLLLLRAWDAEGLDLKLAQAGRPAGRRLLAGVAPAAGAGLLMAILTFFHPFDVIPIFALLWTAPLLFGLAGYGWLARDWVPPIVASAVWLPAFLYNYSIFLSNPAMRAWDLQNLMTTPTVDRLLIALGLNLLLAGIALLGLRRLERRHLVMAAWLLSVLVIIFLPLRFQRRMMGGVQFPLAALAAVSLAWGAGLLVRLAGRRGPLREHAQGAVMFGLVLVLLPLQSLTPYYLLQREWSTMKKLSPPAWLRTETAGVLRWLELNGRPDSRVLSSYEIGNYVPAKTGLRCVLGHYALTIDAESKRDEIQRFHSAEPGDDFRLAALRRWQVRYVLQTPFERRLGPFDPASRDWLKEVFRVGEDGEERAIVYEVVGPAAPPSTSRRRAAPVRRGGRAPGRAVPRAPGRTVPPAPPHRGRRGGEPRPAPRPAASAGSRASSGARGSARSPPARAAGGMSSPGESAP